MRINLHRYGFLVFLVGTYHNYLMDILAVGTGANMIDHLQRHWRELR
jgi:hypothetical protein